ncbi:putative WRKY transcription factor 70 [Dendrobium catenatum]|uniref:Putative WRKY transcription factor 70 n=1 Tax=Dendrobium catenatum TaxID=906689 RepID=A0A2I0WEY6_9ASPA|nr:putative WRKY transcription factor 70 [Dendrobium catenatum]
MASSNMGHRDALNELARGQEVKERLRSILRLSPAVTAAPASSGGGDQGESSSDGKAGSVGQENNRKKSHSWTTSSCAPYDDGFQWRKYGEKKISKSKFTRDALNELARSQLEISTRLRSLLRLSPADEVGAEEDFAFYDDESMGAVVCAVPMGSNGTVDGEHQKRRKKSHRWTTSSCAPYDDGFQWRKYGEKKISKSKFTRSYYRCAYRDEQGCLATKQVQQKEMEDPPMFLVTCSNEHTCNCLSSLFLTEQSPVACSMNLHF